jgi:hypothetical protein
MRRVHLLLIAVLSWQAAHAVAPQAPRALNVMFLGDHEHHQPDLRAQQLMPPLHQMGINLFYTDEVDDLNLENLRRFALPRGFAWPWPLRFAWPRFNCFPPPSLLCRRHGRARPPWLTLKSAVFPP